MFALIMVHTMAINRDEGLLFSELKAKCFNVRSMFEFLEKVFIIKLVVVASFAGVN